MATGTYDNKLINDINQIAMFYVCISVWTQVEACDHMNPEQMRAYVSIHQSLKQCDSLD